MFAIRPRTDGRQSKVERLLSTQSGPFKQTIIVEQSYVEIPVF